MQTDIDERSRRKAEHLEAVHQLGDPTHESWFRDVALLPNCAPEVIVNEVSLTTQLCGLRMASPVIINAMTGGTEEAYEINRRLAIVARRHGLAMAVGSEMAALQNESWVYTYAVVRKENPDGIVMANVGMNATPEACLAAIDLISAQFLQVHWNVAQELFMAEGDRDFRGALARLTEIVQTVDIPVIAKEVGQGIAAPEAVRFQTAGVAAIDVGGRGGTNFIAIEAQRRHEQISDEWLHWGIPTPVALCEVLEATDHQVEVIASGGIRSGHDIAKALAMGASAVGIAAPLLRLVIHSDWEEALDAYIEELHTTLRQILVLTGCRNWEELQHRPVVISGHVREWLEARGKAAMINRLGTRYQGF